MYKVTISGQQQHITAKNRTLEFSNLKNAQQHFFEMVYELNIDEDQIDESADGLHYADGNDYYITITFK